MKLEEIKELMGLLEEKKLKKIHIKNKDFEVSLEKESLVPENPLPTYLPQAVEKNAPVTEEKSPSSEGEIVTSPMVGTFYSSPAPDKPNFVKVGDQVDVDTVICIVEAMKVMNEVKAGVKGTVAEILVDDAEPVEFGTEMFRIV